MRMLRQQPAFEWQKLNRLGIAIIGIILAATFFGSASATHLYSGYKIYTNKPKYCVNSSFGSSLTTAITTAANDMNALPSSFTLSQIPYDSNCYNHIYQSSFSPNYIAMSAIYTIGSPLHINHVDTAVNTYYSWTGSLTSCTNSEPLNLRYTMHHEFGHWISMHHPSSIEDTVMNVNFNCAYWNAYKTHDSDTIRTVYP